MEYIFLVNFVYRENHGNTTVYLSIIPNHVRPFMATVYPSTDHIIKLITDVQTQLSERIKAVLKAKRRSN